MHGRIPPARVEIIEKIAAQVRRRTRKRGPVPEALARAYYHGVDEEDLAERDIADLAGAALAHLQFAARRRRGQALVRLYNPTSKRDGWSSTHTAVEVVTDDMPFLVDSLAMILTQLGIAIHLTVHPVLSVRRDRRGQMLEVRDDAEPGDGLMIESWQRMEIDRQAETQFEQIRQRIVKSLDDVRVACTDWGDMRRKAREICHELEVSPPPLSSNEALEGKALLEWMEGNHFTFLGYREYRLLRGRAEDQLVAIPETGLGILRPNRPGSAPPQITSLKGDIRKHARDKVLMVITKANSVSTVHRSTYLDYVSVKTFDDRGNVNGERRFLGLFTSSAYLRSPREIPVLRHKVQRVITHFGLAPNSHDGKAVLHVLETYPRDELFQSSVPDLIRNVRGIVNLYERQRVRILARRDAFRRFYSCLVYAPRDRYNTQVRQKIEGIMLDAFRGTALESQVQLSESTLARVHIIVRTNPEDVRKVDLDALEARVARAVHTWQDSFNEALQEKFGELEGLRLARRLAGVFPAGYQEDVSPEAALSDVAKLLAIAEDASRLEMWLDSGSDGRLRFRLFRAGAPIALSDALPVLENMGLTVISERPYRVALRNTAGVWIQDFEVESFGGLTVDPASVRDIFHEAFAAIWSGAQDNDGFNRLVLAAGLRWRQIMVLRAYCRYLLQTGIPFSQPYMERVMASNRDISRLLWQIFAAQFDPEFSASRREREITRLASEIEAALDAVTSLDEDRILRRFFSVVRASLRTNFYCEQASGGSRAYLSVKLSSRNIPDLPLPKPMFEIFVYSPRVEGVHLRGGYVARGGIRWSDRREDFRTEILGLMKAQNVKNTLIVPMGAKGGFVAKQLPAGGSREQVQSEVVDCYQTFIRGLLDLTDNIAGGKIVPPARVIRRDPDDAYLVVAADKGTATFSDIANSIAAEYSFWLGDAFASGGSAGYDHKKMGITARGAWECVKRHFREIGVDVQSHDFTVAAIGDMGGDVFGNGMLCSKHVRLLAAFNHQHVFLDPNPDLAASYRERQRLFRLPRSTWEDYDRSLISRGGGIYPRSAKSIRLSREVQSMLGVKNESMTPQDLIRAILCMPVDLLWNGGIGTYVKASDETHAEVGDRANDAVRVNGNDLRCKVVGEGGNLGLSQRGRIEYALAGGRLNTDFIDNSGGVDCSDHEVNIKIALNLAAEAGKLTRGRRDRLLADMTEEVAGLVLRDNYLQSQALSMIEVRAADRLGEHAHFIRQLELEGLLNRSLEFLPSAEDLDERSKSARGLTRPELAVVLAYSKMALYARLVESDVPEDPYLGRELGRYFPERMQKRYGGFLGQHRLRREIIATATTNSLVNRMGPTFARRVQEDTGADAATVARAYTIARESFDIRDTWADIEALDNRVDTTVQYEMMIETMRLLRFCTYWLITRPVGELDIERQVTRLRPGLAELSTVLPDRVQGGAADRFTRARDAYLTAGVPAALAARMAGLDLLHAGPDVVEVSAELGLPVPQCAGTYFTLAETLGLDWLQDRAVRLKARNHWQAVARGTLRDGVYRLQRRLCTLVLQGARNRSPGEAVDAWLGQHRSQVAHVRQTLDEMRSQAEADLAALSVAVQSVRRLAEG